MMRLLTICLALAALPASGTAEQDPARITTIDGESFTGRLVRVAAGQAEFVTEGRVRKIPVRDLWEVRFADQGDPMETRGGKLLALTGKRGVLSAETIAVREGKVHVETKLLGRAVIDLSAVAAIYLPAAGQRPLECRKSMQEMALPVDKRDYLIALGPKKNWVPVPGVLKAIGPEKITFQFGSKDRTINRKQVQSIRLAVVDSTGKPPTGRLVGRDGSAVPFEKLKVEGESIALEGGGLLAKAAKLSAVAQIRFGSARCDYLSALKPAKVVQSGLFDVTFPYRADRSTAGGGIRLRGQVFARGLGMHSRCDLIYDLAGKYKTFAALAGIDDAGGRRGNAVLKIFGDGKELLKPLKLKGGAKPVPLRLSVAGVKRLRLVVDFGDDGIGVGDHVSLAEARLIKP